jgi:hypothetical protein
MTLLSHFPDAAHASGPSVQAHRRTDRAGAPPRTGAADTRLAAIRRLLAAAFAILLAASALTGIIALKAAAYLSHLNY